MSTTSKTVLVTGANGYIGSAIARAFVRAGWTVYGLVRRESATAALAKEGVHPLVGSPADLAWLDTVKDVDFDVVSSNTEDVSDMEGHYRAVREMLDTLASRHASASGKERLLALISSGCKDYGHSPLADDPSLAPHTEQSPLDPPPMLVHRTECMKLLLDPSEGGAAYDPVVFRPTNVYGYSSSYWHEFFSRPAAALAAANSEAERECEYPGDARTVLHGCHVDDAAEAYVAVAAHPERKDVAGQAFNVSNRSFNTLEEIARAASKEYGIEVRCDAGAAGPDDLPVVSYSQWVSSDRVRKLTGWEEKRPGFVEGFHQYRLEYEQSLEGGSK
ncbi:hypothetical protein JCM6882_005018 [Rhodosporidiobolus microsporus]